MTAPSDTSVVTCPGCAADTVKLLDFSSSISLVWYLRCNSCGHVWTLPKGVDGAAPPERRPLSADDVQRQRKLRPAAGSQS